MLSKMGISLLSYHGMIFPNHHGIIWAVVRNCKLKILGQGEGVGLRIEMNFVILETDTVSLLCLVCC